MADSKKKKREKSSLLSRSIPTGNPNETYFLRRGREKARGRTSFMDPVSIKSGLIDGRGRTKRANFGPRIDSIIKLLFVRELRSIWGKIYMSL